MKTLAFLCLILYLHHVQSFDRQLLSEINPGCIQCNSKTTTMLYTKSVGEKDTIHNIWDFTMGKPTIMFAVTTINATLNVTWQNNLPISIQLSESPKYSFAVVFDKIWEFNDDNNTATFFPENKTATRVFDTRNMMWERVNIVQQEGEAMVKVTAHEFGYGADKRKGEISIKLDLYPYTAYAFDLPHLIHSSNTTLVDVIFENMTVTENFNGHSRFAMELLVISTEKTNKDEIKINMRKGLDDEHTPGIFEIIELVTPESLQGSDGGFIQYRPVSYTKAVRAVSTSTNVNIGIINRTEIPTNTTAKMFYSGLAINFELLVEKVIICLGGKGDGYYNKTQYSIWSFTMGYGSPPMEGFSLFVIMIISIGLGIPFILMVMGGVYVCVKRRRKLDNQPEILIED